jgi:FtsZ-interacting cell division protein ZipA
MKIKHVVMIAVVLLFAVGCTRKRKAFTPPKKTAPQAEKKEDSPKKVEKANKIEKKTPKIEKKEPKQPEPTADVNSKANLEKCYLELYCAQKHGDMANLLKIYEKYGFKTPKQWTKAYIEAAKDTDWVSDLARKASKACKSK